MAAIKQSAFLTAVNLITTGAAPGNAVLAAAAYSALSIEHDNSLAANLMPYGAFVISVPFTLSPTVGRRLLLYQVPALNGADYAMSPAASLDHLLVGYCSVAAQQAAQRQVFISLNGGVAIPIPPAKHKWLVKNDTDQQMAVSWTVDLYPFGWQTQ